MSLVLWQDIKANDIMLPIISWKKIDGKWIIEDTDDIKQSLAIFFHYTFFTNEEDLALQFREISLNVRGGEGERGLRSKNGIKLLDNVYLKLCLFNRAQRLVQLLLSGIFDKTMESMSSTSIQICKGWPLALGSYEGIAYYRKRCYQEIFNLSENEYIHITHLNSQV